MALMAARRGLSGTSLSHNLSFRVLDRALLPWCLYSLRKFSHDGRMRDAAFKKIPNVQHSTFAIIFEVSYRIDLMRVILAECPYLQRHQQGGWQVLHEPCQHRRRSWVHFAVPHTIRCSIQSEPVDDDAIFSK